MPLEDSVLTTTKQRLGIQPDYEAFDLEILLAINTALAEANQFMGPLLPLTIEDVSATWEEFNLSQEQINMLKTFIFLSVKLVFDPPSTSYHLEALKGQIEKLIFRLNVNREHDTYVPPIPEEEVV